MIDTVTFYVDCEYGNDENNGKETSKPLKTISKINSKIFSPGEFILFKRGCTWNETLIIPSSGEDNNRFLYFGAYGNENDDLPIIDVKKKENRCIDLNGNNYIHLKNLHLKNSNSKNLRGWSSHHITVENCILENSESTNFYVYGSNIIVINSTFRNSTREHGIYIDATSNVKIKDSKFYYNKQDGIKINSMNIAQCYNITIQNNQIFLNGWDGISDYSSKNSIIKENIIFGNHGRGIGFSYNSGGGEQYSAKDCMVENNYILSEYKNNQNPCINVNQYCSGHIIKNNILFINYSSSPFINIMNGGSINYMNNNIYSAVSSFNNGFLRYGIVYNDVSWKSLFPLDNSTFLYESIIFKIEKYIQKGNI